MIQPLKLLTTLIIIITFSSTIFAQKANITGTVRDKISEEGLIGATVVIKNTTQGGVTDISGQYKISSLQAGEYTLEVNYLGYEVFEITLTLAAGEARTLDIKLDYQSVEGAVVVVTAQAEGQMASINQQLSDISIKNIISSKKIQETPNANAAEAIGRIPGVSIVRNGGEGNKVVIRGLAPKFNKVQIEGISMASTGGDDRSADLSMISPYMLDGIEISKAAMADQEADAIGGVVNFILRQAPKNLTFGALLQGGYSSLNSTFDNYKLVLGGSNRFFNKKLGVFAQIDLERRDRSANEVAVNYTTLNSTKIALGTMAVKDVRRDIKRTGATVVLDYTLPSGSLKMINFASLINNKQESRYELYNPSFSTHSYGINLRETDVSVLTSALKYKDRIGAFSWDIGISYSQSNNKLPQNTDFFATESNAFESEAAFTNRPDSIQFYARNNIMAAKVQRISKLLFDTNEKVFGADVNLTFEHNFSDNVNMKFKFGGKYKKLNKEFSQESFTIPVAQSGHGSSFVAASIQAFPWLSDSLAADVSKLPYHLFVDENYAKNDFPTGVYAIQNVPDVAKINEFANLAEEFYIKDHIYATKDNYNGFEEYKAAYIMPVFKIGRKITFIPGLRYESNTTTYTAVRGNETFLDWDAGYFHHDTTIVRSNGVLLPMIHLKYKATKWFDIRLAYTQTLSRPSFNKIIPKWNILLSSIDFNNPFLRPARSENFDVYLSAYKSKLGLFTIGGFYKKINDLIYDAGKTVVKEEDITGHDLPEDSLEDPISKIINNANAGDLYGIEVEWQTRFWYLNNFLKGFVLTANYTKIFSSVDYERSTVERSFIQMPPWEITEVLNTPYNERLIQQPSDIFNLTLGYDFKKTSARLSFVYQDDIFSKANTNEDLRGATSAYFRFDFSVNQKLPWKGFEAILNFSNLNSSKEQDLLITSGNLTRAQYYGFTLDLGVRYRIK